MASDDDIARLLPEPPPPRPARREATIAAALRRFDGAEEIAPVAATAVPRRPRLSRGQLGLAMSVALIALIGAPAALITLADRFPAAPPTTSTPTAAAPEIAAPRATPRPSRRSCQPRPRPARRAWCRLWP